jgi:hypothetical protein
VDRVSLAVGDRLVGDLRSRLDGEALMAPPAPRAAEWTVSVPAMIKFVGPLVLMPFTGWVWHTESSMTILALQVENLEEQVNNYEQVERHMIDMNARLEEIQHRLDAAPPERRP